MRLGGPKGLAMASEGLERGWGTGRPTSPRVVLGQARVVGTGHEGWRSMQAAF